VRLSSGSCTGIVTVTTAELFSRLFGALDQAGIPYMLTGSFASSFHGVPRATQDIDVVIAPTVEQLRAFIRLLGEERYYVDEESALEAQRQQSIFNIIDLATGWKVDLIIRKSRPFSRQEFERRQTVEFQGRELSIATAEDVCLAKLEWARSGGSQRQIDDVAGILKIRADELDTDYLLTWIGQLELGPQWEAACRAAGMSSRGKAQI